MSAIRSRVTRAVYRAGTAALLLGLMACAGQPTESQVPRAADLAISAEEVEQIPIQELAARARAAREARRCRDPASARGDCDRDEVEPDQIFGPDTEY